MVLIFLIILAFLGYAILRQLESGSEIPAGEPELCPKCGGEVEPDWLLCPRCREILKESCRGCGYQVAGGHRYCPLCGTERRGSS